MSKNGFVANKRCCIGLGCPPFTILLFLFPKVTKEGMLGNLFDQWPGLPPDVLTI